MITAVLVIYLLVVLLMVGVILIQKNEGGGLVSSATGGLVSTRGSQNFLTRFTAILASLFFGLSLLLAILFRNHVQTRSSILSAPVSTKTSTNTSNVQGAPPVGNAQESSQGSSLESLDKSSDSVSKDSGASGSSQGAGGGEGAQDSRPQAQGPQKEQGQDSERPVTGTGTDPVQGVTLQQKPSVSEASGVQPSQKVQGDQEPKVPLAQ